VYINHRIARFAPRNRSTPNDTRFPVSLFGRWQLIRKLYLGTFFRQLMRRRRLDRALSFKTDWVSEERVPTSRTTILLMQECFRVSQLLPKHVNCLLVDLECNRA